MFKLINKQRNKKGFTLIELVVVIAILGILALIAIPRFSTVTDNAKNKAALAEHRIAVSAVQMYLSESNGSLPTASTQIDPFVQGGVAKLTLTTFDYTTAPVTIVTTSTATTPVVTTTRVN